MAETPQSHQLVGRNSGAPSAKQVGAAIEVIAILTMEDIEARFDCAASRLDGVAGWTFMIM